MKLTVSKTIKGMAIMGVLLATGSLQAQYYLIEDFSTATPGYYGYHPVGYVETDVSNAAIANGRYYINGDPQTSITQIREAADADKGFLTSGQNYLYLNSTHLDGTPYFQYFDPYSSSGNFYNGLKSITIYSAASYNNGEDIDFEEIYIPQVNLVEKYKFRDVNLGAFDPALHGHKVVVQSNENTIESEIYTTDQGIWNKTVIETPNVRSLSIQANPRGSIITDAYTNSDNFLYSAELDFTTPIILGLKIFEYAERPSWAPTTTQSQTISFDKESGVVGEVVTTSTTATDRKVTYIVTDPSIAKPNDNGGLDLLKEGTTEVLAYVANDYEYDAAFKIITLTVSTGTGLWTQGNNFSFSLQANPVGNEARFTFEAAGNGASIVITDLSGKTVAVENIASSATEVVIAVDNLTKGIYIAKYSDNAGKTGTLKLIK